MFLAIAAVHRLCVHQLHVESAFINAPLHENAYVTTMSNARRLALDSLLESTEDGVRLLVGVDMDSSEAVQRLTLYKSNLISLRSVEHTDISKCKSLLHLSPAGRPR